MAKKAAAADIYDDSDDSDAEEMRELDMALDAYCYDADDPELKKLLGQGASSGNEKEGGALKKPWVGMTGHQRNVKFMYQFMPILKGYRKMQLKARTMRKREKPKDATKYKREKEAMLDAQHSAAAPMIKKLLEEMGGLYNKAAQDLVTRGMVVPPQWVEELKGCFEDMPKRSWAEMEKAIGKGLAEKTLGSQSKPVMAGGGGGGGKSASLVSAARSSGSGSGGLSRSKESSSSAKSKDHKLYFRSIDPEPLAAASIGQVHCATTLIGSERVIIKVLYPEIRHFMAADLANLKQAVTLVSQLVSMDMKDTIEAVSLELYANFPRELDFRIETCFTERARSNLRKHSPNVLLPRLYTDLSSTSILTQERVEGDTIASLCKQARQLRDSCEGAAANGNAEEAYETALQAPRKAFFQVLECLGKQIFFDGFFHADPHPGNVMVQRCDGKPVLIDWGQCMELTLAQKRKLCELTLLLRTRCMPLISSVLATQGFAFSTGGDDGATAALMYFFFDSAVKGPFEAEILKMRDLVRYKPTQAGYLTAIPREVVFFGRVMTSIRRNCEDLGIEVSAIDVFAPFARQALDTLLGPPPPVRTLGKMSSQPQQQGQGQDGGVGRQPLQNGRVFGGGAAAGSGGGGAAAVPAVPATAVSLWDPSRILCLLPSSTAGFEWVEDATSWAMAHPSVCDDFLDLALRFSSSLPAPLLEALIAGIAHDTKALSSALEQAEAWCPSSGESLWPSPSSPSSAEGTASTPESRRLEVSLLFEEASAALALLRWAADHPTLALSRGRVALSLLASLGLLPDLSSPSSSSSPSSPMDTTHTPASFSSSSLPPSPSPGLDSPPASSSSLFASTSSSLSSSSSSPSSSLSPPPPSSLNISSGSGSGSLGMSFEVAAALKRREVGAKRWAKVSKAMTAAANGEATTATAAAAANGRERGSASRALTPLQIFAHAKELVPYSFATAPPWFRTLAAVTAATVLFAVYGFVDLLCVALVGQHALALLAAAVSATAGRCGLLLAEGALFFGEQQSASDASNTTATECNETLATSGIIGM